jgi:hypothetical protein
VPSRGRTTAVNDGSPDPNFRPALAPQWSVFSQARRSGVDTQPCLRCLAAVRASPYASIACNVRVQVLVQLRHQYCGGAEDGHRQWRQPHKCIRFTLFDSDRAKKVATRLSRCRRIRDNQGPTAPPVISVGLANGSHTHTGCSAHKTRDKHPPLAERRIWTLCRDAIAIVEGKRVACADDNRQGWDKRNGDQIIAPITRD